jgi:voltage-gated potassium channel
MGTIISVSLADRKKPFVVIDVDEECLVETCEERGWLYVVGDATDDGILQRAGIARAKSLATVLPTDADNIYVVLSARMLSPDMQIIVRASDEKAVEKLQRAGATRVVSPFSSGAQKMARFMLTPSIEDFLEIADSRGNELELADVQITAGSPYIGKALEQTDLREKGVMVIGIRRANGERLMPPPGSAIIEQGDSLFAFGNAEAVNRLIGQINPEL